MSKSELCPVNVVTGFLGSGKTTLLNRLLRHPGLADTAVIINEFGDTALDHWLVEGGDEEIVTLDQGCICCSLRGDLVRTLRRLFQQAMAGEIPRFRRVLIETTGLADPAPVIQTLMQDPLLAMEARLGGILTVVDALHGAETLANHREARRQAAMADRIVISKTDLEEAHSLDAVITDLRAAGIQASVVVPGDSGLDPAELLDIGTSATDGLRRWLQLDGLVPMGAAASKPAGNAHTDMTNLVLQHDAAMPPADMDAFLDMLCDLHGRQLLRLKGIVQLTDDPGRPAVVHAVRGTRHPVGRLAAWPADMAGTTLVCIGEGLDTASIQDLWGYARTRA